MIYLSEDQVRFHPHAHRQDPKSAKSPKSILGTRLEARLVWVLHVMHYVKSTYTVTDAPDPVPEIILPTPAPAIRLFLRCRPLAQHTLPLLHLLLRSPQILDPHRDAELVVRPVMLLLRAGELPIMCFILTSRN